MSPLSQNDDWSPHPRYARVFLKKLVTTQMNPGLNVNLVRVAPAGEISPHIHDASTETFYVLAGCGMCRIGDKEILLEPGVCAYAPPAVLHSVHNTGDDYLEAISVFNPPIP